MDSSNLFNLTNMLSSILESDDLATVEDTLKLLLSYTTNLKNKVKELKAQKLPIAAVVAETSSEPPTKKAKTNNADIKFTSDGLPQPNTDKGYSDITTLAISVGLLYHGELLKGIQFKEPLDDFVVKMIKKNYYSNYYYTKTYLLALMKMNKDNFLAPVMGKDYFEYTKDCTEWLEANHKDLRNKLKQF